MTLLRFILFVAIGLQPVIGFQAGAVGVNEPASVCCGADICNCCPESACPCHEVPKPSEPAPPATPPAERVSVQHLFSQDHAPSYAIVPIEHRQRPWHADDQRPLPDELGDRLARLCLWLT